MTSPARCTMTVSPGRMSLRWMSSSLCSVARSTVTPPTKTGSSTANGVRTPVRPTLTSMDVQPRRGRGGGELVGDRPAGVVGHRAERLLQLERVDLDHHAVDVEVQIGAARLPLRAARRDLFDGLVAPHVRMDAEALRAQPLQGFPVTGDGAAAVVQDGLGAGHALGAYRVVPDAQRPRGGHARVELPDAAGGRVARVHERRQAGLRRAPR